MQKKNKDETQNTFRGELEKKRRGCSNILKRDYELTEEQLKKRECTRRYRNYNSENKNAHGILIWYDKKLDELDYKTYTKILIREYSRQRGCAIRGYIGRKKPSEHFLFDFDLEQMLKDNVYCMKNDKKEYITKWWDGEIRHWTVNDGVWKK